MTIRQDHLAPNENQMQGMDVYDPRLLSMDNDSIVNNVPDKKIDERFLQLCNKYPFVNISPKLFQSQIFLSAGIAKDFIIPDGTLLIRFCAVADSYVSFYNVCPAPSTIADKIGSGAIMLPAKTLSPLYYIDAVRTLSFYSATLTTVCIEYGE